MGAPHVLDEPGPLRLTIAEVCDPESLGIETWLDIGNGCASGERVCSEQVELPVTNLSANKIGARLKGMSAVLPGDLISGLIHFRPVRRVSCGAFGGVARARH